VRCLLRYCTHSVNTAGALAANKSTWAVRGPPNTPLLHACGPPHPSLRRQPPFLRYLSVRFCLSQFDVSKETCTCVKRDLHMSGSVRFCLSQFVIPVCLSLPPAVSASAACKARTKAVGRLRSRASFGLSSLALCTSHPLPIPRILPCLRVNVCSCNTALVRGHPENFPKPARVTSPGELIHIPG
jgi:hypothetical protein